MIELTFEVVPQGAKRARSSGRGGRHYTPDDYRSYLESLRTEWMLAGSPRLTPDMWPSHLQDMPTCAEIRFHRPRPASDYLKSGGLRKGARVYPTGTPDIDNLEKGVYDAMSGYLFDDDRQIVDAHCYKRYALSHEPPRIEVRLAPIIT